MNATTKLQAAKAVTRQTPFAAFPVCGHDAFFFEVRAGTNADDALERASGLLANAIGILIDHSLDGMPESMHGALFIAEAAKALVDSVIGRMPVRDGAAGATAPDLLAELRAADQIIVNSVGVMTDAQKEVLLSANDQAGLGRTWRQGERAVLLARAGGAA